MHDRQFGYITKLNQKKNLGWMQSIRGLQSQHTNAQNGCCLYRILLLTTEQKEGSNEPLGVTGRAGFAGACLGEGSFGLNSSWQLSHNEIKNMKRAAQKWWAARQGKLYIIALQTWQFLSTRGRRIWHLNPHNKLMKGLHHIPLFCQINTCTTRLFIHVFICS